MSEKKKVRKPEPWKETGVYTPSVFLTVCGNAWFEDGWYDLYNLKRLHRWLKQAIQYLEQERKRR